MLKKLCLCLFLSSSLSGCYVVVPLEMTQRMDFDYVASPPRPLSYTDSLCCPACQA